MHVFKSGRGLPLLLLLFCVFLVLSLAHPARGQSTDETVPRVLDIPGFASGLNDRGDVVGRTEDRAFLWTSEGGVLDLGMLPGSTICEAAAVNNLRQVVGWCWGGSDPGSRAFLWTAADGMIDIGPGLALAINDRGEVAGGRSVGPAWSEAWRWMPGQPEGEALGVAGTQSIAMGINEAGTICGGGPDSWSLHGFLWGPPSGLEDLGFAGFARDVNAIGEVATGAAATWGAQIWRRGEGLIELGTPEGRYGAATGINSMSHAVGTTTDNATEYRYAFAWTPEEGYREIGWAESFAYKINEVGEVAGAATGVDGILHPAIWMMDASAEARLRALAAVVTARVDRGAIRRGPGQAFVRAIQAVVADQWSATPGAGLRIRLRSLRARVEAMLRSGQLDEADQWILRALDLVDPGEQPTGR